MHRQEAFPGDEGERETFEGECSGATGQIKAAPGSLPIQNQRNAGYTIMVLLVE